ELENQLTTKSKTLDELRQSLAFSGSADQSLVALSLRIPELCEMMDSIVSQSKQLKTSMLSMLDNWGVYDEVYTKFSLNIVRYTYHLEECKRSAVSLNALKYQVKILQ
ncbi:SYNE2 protein, partial [Bucorvus abyssinicus]|nr:SYNE2 protein [Bucorvus abyssinicus]